MLLWSNQNEFGYLYHWKQTLVMPDREQRIQGLGVTKVVLSPDQSYGIALCEHQDQREGHFGQITLRRAVVFEADSLRIISEIPLENGLYPGFAVWHGNAKVIAAIQTSKGNVALYQFEEALRTPRP